MVKRAGIMMLLLAFSALNAPAQRHKPKNAPQAPKGQKSPAATELPRGQRSDTTIKGTTLEVYQVYQPELKPMVKPELSPTLPPVTKEPTPQEYEVPQQTLYYSYRALPLRPLALGKDTGKLPPQSYVLLGGGNLSTILAEAGLGNLHGDAWKANIQGRYLSQEGKLESQVYRSFLLHGDGDYATASQLYHADLNVFSNTYGLYGYNHDVYHYTFDQTRRRYTGGTLGLGFRNAEPGPWGLDYHPQVQIGYLDARQGSEPRVDIDLPAVKHLDSAVCIQLALNGRFAWAQLGGTTISNNIFQIRPLLAYNSRKFTGHLGVYPSFGSGESVHILPDLLASYALDEKLRVSAGWQAQQIQNNLQQLSSINPYASFDTSSFHQELRRDVFASANVTVGKHINVWGRIALAHYDNIPLFVNDPSGDGKDFRILYDKNVEAFVWGGGIRYALGEDFAIGAEGTWYNFYHQDLWNKVYGEPAVRLKGDASWRVVNGLLVTTYLEVLDNIWGEDGAGLDTKARGVLDFGAAGEYNFASTLSAFVRAENMLGRRNERWLGYPSFGFNLYGGLRFRF